MVSPIWSVVAEIDADKTVEFPLSNGRAVYVLACEGGDLVARRRNVELWRFTATDGRIIGTRGYHAGEELHVVRREDGSVSHLDVGTFILTREPYQPGAPIPGGHPPLG